MNISPYKILKEAIKVVPAVKYALGIAGVTSVLAIIAGFKIDFRVAIFGTIIMIALMFLLLFFSHAASPKNKKLLRLPSLFLAWSFLILTIFSSTLLSTSFFFSWPRDLSFYFNRNIQKKDVIIKGVVLNTNSQPINDARITIDGFDFMTRSNEIGNFMSNLKSVRLGEIITIRVYHEDYKSSSIIRHIKNPEENFEITLTKR